MEQNAIMQKGVSPCVFIDRIFFVLFYKVKKLSVVVPEMVKKCGSAGCANYVVGFESRGGRLTWRFTAERGQVICEDCANSELHDIVCEND